MSNPICLATIAFFGHQTEWVQIFLAVHFAALATRDVYFDYMPISGRPSRYCSPCIRHGLRFAMTVYAPVCECPMGKGTVWTIEQFVACYFAVTSCNALDLMIFHNLNAQELVCACIQ